MMGAVDRTPEGQTAEDLMVLEGRVLEETLQEEGDRAASAEGRKREGPRKLGVAD